MAAMSGPKHSASRNQYTELHSASLSSLVILKRSVSAGFLARRVCVLVARWFGALGRVLGCGVTGAAEPDENERRVPAIAYDVRCSPKTVRCWLHRFKRLGLQGLEELGGQVHVPERYGNWLESVAGRGCGPGRHVGAGLRCGHVPGRYRRGPELGCLCGLADRARSPARCRGPQKAPVGEPHDHAIGRSRGGLTRKVHFASDAFSPPIRRNSPSGGDREPPAGQAADSPGDGEGSDHDGRTDR